MRRYSRPIFVALLLIFAGWCLYSLRTDLGRISLLPVLRSWNLVLLATALSLANYLLRIARWKWYLRRLGHRFGFRFAALTYVAGFAFTLSPGKLGEMARARYYTDYGVPIADVAAAFWAERVMDMIAVLALAVFVLGMLPNYSEAIWSTAAAVAVALLVVAALPWQKLALALRTSSRSPAVPTRVAAALAGTLARAGALQRPDVLAVGFVAGLAAWGAEGLGLFSIASMFEPHVPMSIGIGIYAVAVLIGAVSFLPGGLGSTEAIMTSLLTSQGYAIGDALVITMVCRIVTLWLAVVLGWMAVAALRRRSTVAVKFADEMRTEF